MLNEIGLLLEEKEVGDGLLGVVFFGEEEGKGTEKGSLV